MAFSEAESRLVKHILVPALDKIIKNSSWRKHSKLANESKSVLELITSADKPPHPPPTSDHNQSDVDASSQSPPPGVLYDSGTNELTLAESELILSPIINACSSGNIKIAEPALDCIQKLIAFGYLRGEADPTGGPDAQYLAKLIESVCKCHDFGEEGVELLVLKTILSAVTSVSLNIHGDSLLQIVRTSYDIYLESKYVVNQTTAKASLVQMLVIVFWRMEADSSTVPVQPIVVVDLMEPMEKGVDNDGTMNAFVQGFISKVIHGMDGVLNPGAPVRSSGVHDGAFETKTSSVESTNPADLLDSTDKDMLDAKYWEISMYKTALEGRKGELQDDDIVPQIGNKLKRDAFLVFRALCKLSMKSPPKDALSDPHLMRGKVLALELLKILLENAGDIFRTSERFLGAIKQYLCLSLLKNSSSTFIIIFQLSCSIFISLLSRFRAGLKAEISVFFPMIVLRVLENVAQPNYQQKFIVLRFLEKLCVDSQILVDIFVNYDCDVKSSNIFERMVNGLLKTAQGVPPGVTTTLLPPQDITMKLEAMKCLVAVLKSMGDWMNKQLRIPDPNSAKNAEFVEIDPENGILNEHESVEGSNSQSETSSEVMHAYVDSFDFNGMEFDDAIRAFFKGFRLPSEAQKIDQIMEKFGQRYCKCNPKAFISADSAYVLAYSVIMLNADAHTPMVKNKMSADDFIRNNRGIDDGKDLPEEYLKSLYERISKNEIKMKEDDFALQQKQSVKSNSFLGLDSILNIVVHKNHEEQFKEKASKSESVYCAATDVYILTFMIEVCWAPMLAAFSVPLDQSDDVIIISKCLEGFRSAIHVTSAMSMKTHRDAFMTSLAKFTCLHSPADIKQKNIEAIKAIVTIADEDGNYLQEAWEHILTCVSRFEHLRGPPDATFFAVNQNKSEKSKQSKSNILPVLKKKGATKRGSYDNISGGITSSQVNNLVSKLKMLEQVGEMSSVFTRSQKLNSQGIVDFVKALCKLSMEELRSTSDPRVFCLTKIVEIAHYNMNRIRLVWTSIWNVLSDFFVSIGCSENLSIAIFAMDSLRQLSMKFLEREELTNYNFQNEFMKPFVIVMQKSNAVEIRELIIRCVSQLVLSRVSYVKSGWKSIFMVFTTAAYDDHKSIVFLAFEIIEKIIRDYFPYITETETTTFTDCVNCLIAFTSTKFDIEISLNAISFLHLSAAKFAKKIAEKSPNLEDKDGHLYFWFPLLAGLSELSFDTRPEIRKNALESLFDTLRNHGHHFSLQLWEKVFDSVLFPIFDYVDPTGDTSSQPEFDHDADVGELDQDSWLYETCTVALQLVVDIFVNFYNTVNPLLKKVLTLLVSFIKRPHQSLAGIGIAAFVRLVTNCGELFSDGKWFEVVSSLKDAANATVPDFLFILNRDNNSLDVNFEDEDSENLRRISDAKCRAAVQLWLINAIVEIYHMYRPQLSIKNTLIIFDAVHKIANHAHKINADTDLRSKLQNLGPVAQMQDPPLLRLEVESYQTCLTFVQNLAVDRPPNYEESTAESQLVDLCQEALKIYIEIARPQRLTGSTLNRARWLIPLGSGKKRELTARAPLIVATLQAICKLGDSSFERALSSFLPLFSSLISCEHGSIEVQVALSAMLSSSVGPVLLRSC